MIFFKNEDEVEKLRQSNQLVSKTLAEIAKIIQPGVTTKKLDKVAEEFIRDNYAVPGFLGYRGYPKTLCTSVNDQVVHGIPSDYALQNGDIVSVDCGVILRGYFGDSAYTFEVGEVDKEKKKLMTVTEESLNLAVDNAIVGKRIGDISNAVQTHAEKAGYSVVRELVGHGLGKNLHEEPEVPNFGRRGKGIKLKEGMVICIEPMINAGAKSIITEQDGWTIRTKDRMPSAHFEYAVAVKKGKADVLTTFDYIKEVIN